MRAWVVAINVLAALPGWLACRASPTPDALFAQAEELRLRQEAAASREAVRLFAEAATAWELAGNRRDAARAVRGAGASHWQLGALTDARESYEEALALVRGAGHPLLESEILSDVGVARAFSADSAAALDAAREECRQALDLARQARAGRQEGDAFTCLGEVAYFSQQHERALEFFREAARLFEAAADERGLAEITLLQGHVYSDLSRLDEARAHFDRAHALWTGLGDRRQQAIALVAGARVLLRRGAYQEALVEFQAALARLEPMGDAIWEGSCLTGIAMVYLDMAETDLAIRYWERAFEIFETAGLRNISVDVLMSAASTYLAAGDHATALSRFARAHAIALELGIRRWEALALRGIGLVHLLSDRPDRALQYLERSLELQRDVGGPRLEARTRADLGEAQALLSGRAAAVVSFEEALALSRSASDRVTEARALFGLARSALARDEPARARALIEQALSVAESLRTEVDNRDLRASYVASVYRYHELHVDVLMRLHRGRPRAGLSARAFEASERARARSLLESLGESGVDLRAGVDPDLLKREQMAKKAFEDWATRLRQVDGSPDPQRDAARLAEEHQGLEERYNQIQAEIRRRSPRYAALARPEPLGLVDVQRQVLDANTILLEYALGEERSYLWAVSATDHASIELPPRAEIERAASRVYERLTARHAADVNPEQRRARVERADAEYWHEAASLAEMVIAPVADRIRGKRLLVVADGLLQYIPFAALPAPGRHAEPRPLVADHEIVNLPSASVLAVLRRETASRARPPREVAVLADPVFEADDPRLRARARSAQPPGRPAGTARGRAPQSTPAVIREGSWNLTRLASTRREADAIVAAAPPGTTLSRMDFDASRAAALSPELAQYRIVHFATHGVLDNENPGLSGLILSLFDERGQPQDGFLRLPDIYGLQLPADLVVLSACDTALGRPVRGEGLMGMVRGFFFAGARRVVASLWKVDDEATGELMSRFYAGMLKGQQSPAAALRDAQLTVWRDARWRAPYHWAAFVLQGEWR
jgi:CHAT domain-containing protein/tetratricopeptide (TPR) repeat protein